MWPVVLSYNGSNGSSVRPYLGTSAFISRPSFSDLVPASPMLRRSHAIV